MSQRTELLTTVFWKGLFKRQDEGKMYGRKLEQLRFYLDFSIGNDEICSEWISSSDDES